MEGGVVDPELVQLTELPHIQRTAAPVPARAQLLQSIAESSVGEKLRGLRARVRRRNVAEDDADQQPADRAPEESVEATANPAVPRARSAGAKAQRLPVAPSVRPAQERARRGAQSSAEIMKQHRPAVKHASVKR